MNYLAHQFLSFREPEIQLGNLYGEISRGKDFQDYPADLQKGILLHRSIDSFTDGHQIVKESTKKFHEKYGKYAPIIVDVTYDYFLIKNWQTYTELDFEEYVSECYQLFRNHFESFPDKLQFIVSHLLKYDWFHNYQTLDGIQQTLNGISQRSKFENSIGHSVIEIEKYKDELNEEFQLFFPELVTHCKLFLES